MCYCASPIAAVVAVARALVVVVAVVDQADADREVACLGQRLKDLQDLGVLLDQASSHPDWQLAAEP